MTPARVRSFSFGRLHQMCRVEKEPELGDSESEEGSKRRAKKSTEPYC